MATTLWLVRHGETSSNADGVFQGHIDVRLNERGVAQAHAVAAAVSDVVFNAVYSSDLERAARTAEIIANGRHAIVLEPDLREMNYGVLQGVRYTDAASILLPYGLADAWTDGSYHRKGLAAPGGESLRQFRRRARRFVQKLDMCHPSHTASDVLVVAHGGTLSVLMTLLLGLPAVNRQSFRFANCGITRVSRTPLRTTVDLHNHVVWDEALPVSDRAQSGRWLDPGESHLPRT